MPWVFRSLLDKITFVQILSCQISLFLKDTKKEFRFIMLFGYFNPSFVVSVQLVSQCIYLTQLVFWRIIISDRILQKKYIINFEYFKQTWITNFIDFILLFPVRIKEDFIKNSVLVEFHIISKFRKSFISKSGML